MTVTCKLVLLNLSTHCCTNHDSTIDVGSEKDDYNVDMIHDGKPLISYDPVTEVTKT